MEYAGWSPRQTEAFQAYYGLGKDRSLSALADTGLAPLSTLKKWSRKLHWVEKIAGMDNQTAVRAAEKIVEAKADQQAEKTINQTMVQKALLDAGIDHDAIAKTVYDGIAAVKSTKEGFEVDYGMRLNYLKVAMDLLGVTPIQKAEESGFEEMRNDYEQLSESELEEEYKKRIEILRRFTP